MWWSLKTFNDFIKYVFSNFNYLHISPLNWPHYFGTSPYQVNFLTSSIVILFDFFFTNDWHLSDIFWTFWHLLTFWCWISWTTPAPYGYFSVKKYPFNEHFVLGWCNTVFHVVDFVSETDSWDKLLRRQLLLNHFDCILAVKKYILLWQLKLSFKW